MDRGDLLYTFTKIALWRQTQFRKIIYIDSDVVALRAPDELFDIEAPFAAAPDIGWPDAFNSGVMVISPNMGDYWALQTLASAGDSFDGADQGLLNQYYEHKGWHRLSFTYNCTPNAEYQWEPAYRHHKGNIKMVHFIGKDKPWVKGRFAKGGSGVYSELLGRWWAVYDKHLRTPVRVNQSIRYALANTNRHHNINQVNPMSHHLQLFKSMFLVNLRTFTTVMLPRNASLHPQLMILRLLWLRILHLMFLLRNLKYLRLLLKSHLLSPFQKPKRLIRAELSLRLR